MKLSPLVIASHNEGKVREIRELLAPHRIKILSAAEAGVDEPEETGTTFAENALLKARHAAARSGMAALADDSGLAIPALGGAPGIYSARWAGPEKDFSKAFARIKNELLSKFPSPGGGGPGRGHESRDLSHHAPLPTSPLRGEGAYAAYFICVLALCRPDGETEVFEGRVDGALTFPPRGKHGFGYDPIFIPDGRDVTFGEMAPAEKHKISHRARAFTLFETFIRENAYA